MSKLILVLLLFIFTPPIIAGNDIIITCSSSSCTKSSDLPLFSESYLAPGFSSTQTLKVINNQQDNCNLLFKLNSHSSPNLLSSVQTISIISDSIVWYAGSLRDLFDNNSHQLGYIDNHQFKDYQWTVSLNQSAGNEYQQLNSSFDIDFNFTCDQENTSSNFSCLDISPSQIPQNFKAVGGQNSVILTWDEPVDNFTYYLITYGEDDHAATFGNPNIGGKGTNTYTINNLSANTTYFFKIRIGNGCTSGPFSDVVFATTSGQILIDPPTTSFQPNVLGATDPSTSDAMEISCTKILPYAFLLAFLVNMVIKHYYFITFLISFLSLVFDYYLTQYSCLKYPYFYIGNFISFFLPLLLSFKKPRI